MGMLFNTAATLHILKVANTVFDRDGLAHIKADKGWDTIADNLSPTGNRIFSDLAKPLGIDFDGTITNPTPNAIRWRKYCNTYLDKKVDHNYPNMTLAERVGKGIKGAITSHDPNTGAAQNYAAVEFFASPVDKGQEAVIFKNFDSATPPETTLVITIYTLSADKAFAAFDEAFANDPNLITF